MEDCMKAGGSIKEKCSEIEKEVGPGCSKGHCCCALLDVCLGNPMCDDGRGLCRTACRDGEEVKYGLCGAHCKCCVAINEVLTEVKDCVEEGGVIKEHCTSLEKPLAGGCSSDHFCCCAPRDACTTHPLCDDGFGVCRTWCLKMEREVPGCGHHCKCCTVRPAVCSNHGSDCPGTCVDERLCPHDKHPTFTCSGNSCTCCLTILTPAEKEELGLHI
ncbi:uncharacterized protein LOC123506523 [Portunus trituberculatus]|uniref:uncharacterized protein LOC123506523 n=1 Tax=Portunus trituberculatus TaxID=210409 RepID=UPI001E1CBCB0|nr:uncharacterized protein LOC123506523 [Portunus trituberculatus]